MGECLLVLTNLTHLVIDDPYETRFKHYESISHLTNLTTLKIPLYNSKLSNESVQRLTNLTNLSLGFHTSAIITFGTIQHLKRLKRICFYGAWELEKRLEEVIPNIVIK